MTTTVDLYRPRITVWRVLKIYCYVVGLGTTVLAAHLTMAKLYDGTWQKVSPHVGFLGAEIVQMAGNTVLFEPLPSALPVPKRPKELPKRPKEVSDDDTEQALNNSIERQ